MNYGYIVQRKVRQGERSDRRCEGERERKKEREMRRENEILEVLASTQK